LKNKLRTSSDLAEKQSVKFSIKVVNKTAASATQFAKGSLLHSKSCTVAVLNCKHKQNFIFNKCWHAVFWVINFWVSLFWVLN